MYLLTNPSPPRTHPTRRRIRFAKKRKRSATPPGKEREKTRRILRNGSHNNRGSFSIQNLQTDPSRGNVCKSYDTDRRNHHQYYRVHISRPGVHESRKTHTHTCAYTRRTHARTHTRTPKILIYRVPPRANRVPRVSTVSTPGLINDRWRNGTEYQRRRRPSALHGSRRWDRSATLNRSGVIEAIYTRPMRFHGREREGVTGRDRERKIERKKEKERERERKRERGGERERDGLHQISRDTLHVSQPRRQTDRERISGGPAEHLDDELEADKSVHGSSWAPRSWPDSTRETMAYVHEPSHGTNRCEGNLRVVAREYARETRTGPNLTRGDLYSAFPLTPTVCAHHVGIFFLFAFSSAFFNHLPVQASLLWKYLFCQ